MVQTRYGGHPIRGASAPALESEVDVKKMIGVILMLLSGAAYGQLYKCVDKSGKVEYANICPPGTKQEATGIRNSPSLSPSTAAPQKSPAERDAEFRKRQIERQEAAAKQEKQEVEKAQNQAACDSARGYLKSLQAGLRIRKFNPQTKEFEYLQDSDYSNEIAKAQSAADANCK